MFIQVTYERKIAADEKMLKEMMSYFGETCIHGKKFEQCETCTVKKHFGNVVSGIILPQQGTILYQFTSDKRIDECVQKFNQVIDVLAKKFSIKIVVYVYDGAQCLKIEYDAREILHTTFVIEVGPGENEVVKKICSAFDMMEIATYDVKDMIVGKLSAMNENVVMEYAKMIDAKMSECGINAKISVIGPKISFCTQ